MSTRRQWKQFLRHIKKEHKTDYNSFLLLRELMPVILKDSKASYCIVMTELDKDIKQIMNIPVELIISLSKESDYACAIAIKIIEELKDESYVPDIIQKSIALDAEYSFNYVKCLVEVMGYKAGDIKRQFIDRIKKDKYYTRYLYKLLDLGYYLGQIKSLDDLDVVLDPEGYCIKRRPSFFNKVCKWFSFMTKEV